MKTFHEIPPFKNQYLCDNIMLFIITFLYEIKKIKTNN